MISIGFFFTDSQGNEEELSAKFQRLFAYVPQGNKLMSGTAIARAIFSESPVLVLDEATSALDEATEEKLLSNLRTLTDKTVIIVTHRQAALKICDRAVEF